METARATNPAELAVLVPYILGFHPERSLVVLALEGKRLGLTQRMDLVPEEHARDVVRQMIGHVARSGAGKIAVVAFEREPGESDPMRAELMRLVRSRVIRCATSVVVRDGRWFDPDGLVPRSRPGGEALPEPSRVPAVAVLVGEGRMPLPSRESLRDVVESGTSEVAEDVAAALDAIDTEETGVDPSPVRAWRTVLAPGGADDPEAVAEALVALRDVSWRDALLAALCPGWMPDGLLADEPTAAASAAVAGLDPELALERLSTLVHATPRGEAAPVLTVLAQVAWSRGDGALASIALEEALAIEPGYRLADLLDRLVSSGVRMPSAAA